MLEYTINGFDFIRKNGRKQEFVASFLKNKNEIERFHRFGILDRQENCEVIRFNGKTVHSTVDIFCLKHNQHFTQKVNIAKLHRGCNFCVDEYLDQYKVLKRLTQKEDCQNRLPKHINILPSEDFLDSDKSIIVCKIHGVSTINNKALKRSKYGCTTCARISGAKGRHLEACDKFYKYIEIKTEYDYSLTEYRSSIEPVKIICQQHGVFNQTPRVHMGGHGCPTCAIQKSNKKKSDKGYPNNFGRSSYSKLNGMSNLYVLKITSSEEEFYKVGISKNIQARMKGIERASVFYNCELIFEQCFPPNSAWDIEKVIHFDLKNNRYKPKHDFAGKTECFDCICIDSIMKICQSCL